MSIIPIIGDIIGGILDKKAKDKNNKQIEQMNALLQQIASDRYVGNRTDASDDLNYRREDTEGMRDRMDQYIKEILGATNGFSNADGSSVAFDPDSGTYKTSGGDGDGNRASSAISSESLKRATVDQQTRRDALGRGEADALSVGGDLDAAQADLRAGGPSASVITALINKASQGAIGSQFDKARNIGAQQMTRTGGDNSKMYANLAREQATASSDAAASAELQGLTGSEQLQSSKTARLTPVINSLAARRTAMPNVDLPEDTIGSRNADLSKSLLAARTGAATSLIPNRNLNPAALNPSYMGTPLTANSPSQMPGVSSAGSIVSGATNALAGIDFSKLFAGMGA